MRNEVSPVGPLAGEVVNELLTPMMAYAELLKDSGRKAESKMVWVILENLDRRLCALFIAGLLYAVQSGLSEKIPFLAGYQAQRILGFLDPASNPDTFRQQARSIQAIGSGGLLGKGLYNTDISSVKAGNFLIEEDTDFIFAITRRIRILSSPSSARSWVFGAAC